MEERHAELPPGEARLEAGDGRGLLGVERVRLGGDELPVRQVVRIGLALDADGGFPHEAPLDEGLGRGGRGSNT